MDLRNALHRVRIEDIFRVFDGLTVGQEFSHDFSDGTLSRMHTDPVNALVECRRVPFHRHESQSTDGLNRFHNCDRLLKSDRSDPTNKLIAVHQ